MNESWVKETMDVILDWEIEKATLELRIQEIHTEIEELRKRIEGGQAVIQAYTSKHNITVLPTDDIRPGCFGDKSYPQMLAEIAERGSGYFKVMNAVEILLKASVSTDKRAIQANIYSTLRRLKNKFVKVKAGEYRYVNLEVKGQGKSGLRRAVKEIRERHPNLTRREVQQILVEKGFDFKGKKPGNAVNMAWVSLDYLKEGRQPSLLD